MAYYKVGMSFDIIGHITLYEKVMDAMRCDSSVVGVMDCTVSNV